MKESKLPIEEMMAVFNTALVKDEVIGFVLMQHKSLTVNQAHRNYFVKHNTKDSFFFLLFIYYIYFDNSQ